MGFVEARLLPFISRSFSANAAFIRAGDGATGVMDVSAAGLCSSIGASIEEPRRKAVWSFRGDRACFASGFNPSISSSSVLQLLRCRVRVIMVARGPSKSNLLSVCLLYKLENTRLFARKSIQKVEIQNFELSKKTKKFEDKDQTKNLLGSKN